MKLPLMLILLSFSGLIVASSENSGKKKINYKVEDRKVIQDSGWTALKFSPPLALLVFLKDMSFNPFDVNQFKNKKFLINGTKNVVKRYVGYQSIAFSGVFLSATFYHTLQQLREKR